MVDRLTTKGSPGGDGLLKAFLACKSLLAHAVSRIVKRHEIDDVLQETFIRSFEASGRNAIRHPRAFLLRTATNVALNHVDRADNRLTDSLPADDDTDFRPVSESLDTAFESQERFRAFCRAVRALPGSCRHVFILKMVYGLSQREIAARLTISESTVEKRVARGLLLCRDYLDLAGFGQRRAAGIARRRAG